jgi:hypothetical protein
MNDQDLKNGTKSRKRKNSESSCISSSHSTVSGMYAGGEEPLHQELQAFMLEEYNMDSEKKCAPCLIYLPIKKQPLDESPFAVTIKIRPLTSDEKHNLKPKNDCKLNLNHLSPKLETDQKQLQVESSSLNENSEVKENGAENEKNATLFIEDSNVDLKLEINTED